MISIVSRRWLISCVVVVLSWSLDAARRAPEAGVGLLQVGSKTSKLLSLASAGRSKVNVDGSIDQTFQPCIQNCPTQATVDQLRNLTVPDYAACPEPQRLGEVHDGGYVGCGAKAYSGAEAVLSFGICGFDQLGCDLAGITGAPLFEYDCFNTQLPECQADKQNFKPYCLGKVSKKANVCVAASLGPTAASGKEANECSQNEEEATVTYQDIDTVLLEAGMNHSTNVIMKIDIEGAEWEALKSFTDDHWGRVSTLFLELHLDGRGMPDKTYKEMSEQYLKLLTKLNKHYTMVHFNANNCAGGYMFGDIPIPMWQEITFMNRRLVKDMLSKNKASMSLADIISKHKSQDAQVCLGHPVVMEQDAVRAHYYKGF